MISLLALLGELHGPRRPAPGSADLVIAPVASKLMRVMVALYCGTYDRPPASVTLDLDDTLDVVHGVLPGRSNTATSREVAVS